MKTSEQVCLLQQQSRSVFADILGCQFPERAFILGRERRTYGQLIASAGLIAKRLKANGCSPGSRVGVCLDQGIEYMASLLAIWQVGGISVLIGPSWTNYERERVLKHSGAGFVLADATHLIKWGPIHIETIDSVNCILIKCPSLANLVDRPQNGDAIIIIYTSGSTGEPKGVVLTETSISANIKAVADYLRLDKDSTPIFTPSCYAYSLSQNLCQAWTGGTIVPVPWGLRYPQDVIQAIAERQLTSISGTPTGIRLLCKAGLENKRDMKHVRFVMCGGQFLDVRTVKLINALFPSADVINMYGCTENSPRISYHYIKGTSGLDEQGYFAVGQPVRGTTFRIVKDNGVLASSGEIGEVVITGTSLMREYWKDPAETANRLLDGWFHTRDLGYLDADGLLHLTGRRSNIINVGNEKVSPEEVEKVLLELSLVRDAAVYGTPHPLFGQIVEAKVVLVDEAKVLVGDLQRHCRDKLSAYKVPTRIEIVDKIPRTLYGKLDRQALNSTSF